MNVIDITKQKQGCFWNALADADKGDQIIYHIGDYCGGVHRRDAANAAAQNKCLLFCKRADNGAFAYLVVKR